MSRGRRFLAVVLLVALVLAIVAPTFGWLYLRRSLPATNGTVAQRSVTGAVEIMRDERGIPYIFAPTDRDAFYALGYVHAQDRLWQMEMQRRIGAGTLAEALGEAALETDQFLRTLGTYRSAQSAWDNLTGAPRDALVAYAEGVNAYLAEGHGLPPEFVILGFEPAPWQPVDSLVWAKMMAWNLGDSWGDDVFRAALAARLGPERAAELLPAYPADGPVILPPDAPMPERIVSAPGPTRSETPIEQAQAGALLETRDFLRRSLGLGGKHIGSNNWVVGGERTASGRPLVANDPHLGAQIPSIWYLAGMHGDKLHAVGATLPGLPAVVIGHNENIAWGVTNFGPDVQDLFIEKINPANPNQYEVNGQWVDMAIAAETIRVKGEDEPVQWAARATRHGPLISDATDERGQALALRWPALDPADTTIVAFLGINYAANWEEFTQALSAYVAPVQNFVYADTAGNIGYYGPGKIPIRAGGDGSQPAPGWTDEYAWSGYIPFEDLPHAYNPEQGYIATANNRVTPDDYPYFLTHDWADPYRAQRIVELLTEKSGLTPDDMARIQGDQQSAQARELLPLLLEVQPEGKEQEDALALLRAWDGTISADSAAALVYEAWYKALHQTLLGDDLGGDLGEDVTENHRPRLIAGILKGEAGPWCDDVLTPDKEDCPTIARVALGVALEGLAKTQGEDMAKWRWGDAHKTQFPHNPFSQVDMLKRFFHRSVETGGDNFTVNPSPYAIGEDFSSRWLPSYRQIIDVGDWDNSRFMHTTGQSGNALSAHYADLIAQWQKVEYAPMLWSREKVEQAAKSTLRLTP
jgi:penicillin amidase